MEEKTLFDKELKSTLEHYSIPTQEGFGMAIGNGLSCIGGILGIFFMITIIGIPIGLGLLAFSHLVDKAVKYCANIGKDRIQKVLQDKEIGDMIEKLIKRQIDVVKKELKPMGYRFSKDRPKEYRNRDENSDPTTILFIDKYGKSNNEQLEVYYRSPVSLSYEDNFINFRGYELEFVHDTTEVFKVYCCCYGINIKDKYDCGEVVFELPPPNINELKSVSAFKNIDFSK